MNKIAFFPMRVLVGLVIWCSLVSLLLADPRKTPTDGPAHKTSSSRPAGHAKKNQSHKTDTPATRETRRAKPSHAPQTAPARQRHSHHTHSAKTARPAEGVHKTRHAHKPASRTGSTRKIRHARAAAAEASSRAATNTPHSPGPLKLSSEAALVVDHEGHTLYAKNTGEPLSIASVTKLMTAMVVLDAHLPMTDVLTIEPDDRDRLRYSRSRLREGSQLSREQMLNLALMSSENRAASALSRTTFKGGKSEFVAAMNAKAKALGMDHSQFRDGTGLDEGNQASPEDLVKMVKAAAQYPFIHAATTRKEMLVKPSSRGGPLQYVNTNPLIRAGTWDIRLSKTGYIDVAGHCLVMQIVVEDQPITLVLLRAYGKFTTFADAQRVRHWIRKH